MKTKRNNKFPGLPRFVIYMAVIAVFCFINCLTVEAKDRMGNPYTKENYGIMNVKIPVFTSSLPQWLLEVYMNVILQEIDEQPSDNTSGNLVEIARKNVLSDLRNLSTGTTIVLPSFDKSNE